MLKINKTHGGNKGLTLIELLITIAVLAIVAAIAIPVVTNVVSSTNERAVAQTQADIADFTEKYSKTGGYTYDSSTGTFSGYVDLNGDGDATEDEKIEELVIDTDRFNITPAGDNAHSDATVANFYDMTPNTTFSVEGAGGEESLLPTNVLAYIPFSGTSGDTSTPVYTQTGTLTDGMTAVRSSQLSSAETQMTGSSVSGYTAAGSLIDGWLGSSELTSLMSVGSASPFSVEFWWYNSGFVTGSYGRVLNLGGYHDSGTGIEIESNRTNTTSYIFYEYSAGGSSAVRASRGTYNIPVGWNHIYWAVDPTGGDSYVGINGTVTSFSNYLSSVQPLDKNFSLGHVDGGLDDATRGYFQELIVRNEIPYTSNFTPSTTPLIEVG